MKRISVKANDQTTWKILKPGDLLLNFSTPDGWSGRSDGSSCKKGLRNADGVLLYKKK